MEVRRTVPVKLDVDSADADLLRETIQQFLDAANYVVDVAQDGEWVETRKSVLHDETYSAVRERTNLHSNHVQSARDRAVDALKSVVAKWKQGEYASLPTFTTPFCEYNQRNATVYDDHATLSTVDGRTRTSSRSGERRLVVSSRCSIVWPTKSSPKPSRRSVRISPSSD